MTPTFTQSIVLLVLGAGSLLLLQPGEQPENPNIQPQMEDGQEFFNVTVLFTAVLLISLGLAGLIGQVV